MEEAIQTPGQMPAVPPIHVFRDAVNQITSQRDAAAIKLLYLTASRCSEVCTKVTPYELANRKTKPYGRYLQFKFADFETRQDEKEKILLLQLAVAKRTKKVEEGKMRLALKIVGLPCNPVYEPWTVDLLKFIRDQAPQKKVEDRLQVDLTRMSVQNIVRRNLGRFFPRIHPHSLRHYRITHLITDYGFNPYQITAYTGWSLKSTFGAMGVQVSSNLDIYAHLQWRDYVQKLLKPISAIF